MKKKILGLFRGFPGLGRVVSGVSLLETLRNQYGCEVKVVSYLQGNQYLKSKGYVDFYEAEPMDYCSIGLLPTSKMGHYIHQVINDFKPNAILVDGEPLMIQSIKISHKNIAVVALLNPADVDNPNNDKEAMEYFNCIYSLADMAIIHGLRTVTPPSQFTNYISIKTILRREILEVTNKPCQHIYCLLGGGTVNADHQFSESTIKIGKLCLDLGKNLPDYKMHIVCSSSNIYDALCQYTIPQNVLMYNQVLDAREYYSKACLIITRSGRNTLSELAYLKIPAISFVSGCTYRESEQRQNVDSLYNSNIVSAPVDIKVEDIKAICLNLIRLGKGNGAFECGNEIALEKIISL